MADRAKVTSVDAIESFRANLILFLSKARPTLEEVSSEVLRLRGWLQNDKRHYWEHEMKMRGRKLEAAQTALFSAMLSKMREVTAAQQRNVQRAKQSVDEAENKMRLLKKWDRELDSQADPLVKQVDQMHGYIASEMVKAVAYLAQVVKTLDAYADVRLPGTEPPPPEAGAAPTGGNAA